MKKSLTLDERIAQWQAHLDETRREANNLYSSRFMFEQIQRMFVSNERLAHEGSNVLNWLFTSFYTHYLISIRREMEAGGGYPTLMNFLIELEEHSESVLTRARYVKLYAGSGMEEYGIPDEHFDNKIGVMCRWPRTSPDQDCISADSVRRTREQLVRDTKKLVLYANAFIAHRTSHEAIQLTIADMFIGMNRIFDVYARFDNLITANSRMNKFPVHQYDWSAPFRFPWITDKFEPFVPPE